MSRSGAHDIDENKEAVLVEQENPTANPDRLSLSGVRYGSVLDGLSTLYPPTDLEKRNAVSRSDGYWPFINNGQDPPKEFTYGEFDLYFFADLIDTALQYYNEWQDKESTTWDGKVFTDIGSGTGRLVFAAAALHPGWKLCRGVEVLDGIHKIAMQTLEKCRYELDVNSIEEQDPFNDNAECSEDENESECLARDQDVDARAPTWRSSFGTVPFRVEPDHVDDWLTNLKQQYDNSPALHDDDPNEDATTMNVDDDRMREREVLQEDSRLDLFSLPKTHSAATSSDEPLYLAPIQFVCGSFEDPYEYIGDSDLIFVFSSCMSNSMMSSLSEAFGRQCRPGTIIITTDYSLPLSGAIEPLEDDERMPYGHFKFDLLESINGWCWLTGGASTAHIHRVVESLWEEGTGPRQKPVIPLEEQAYRVVKAYEAGELTDTNKFLREVRNNMIFLGIPESWYSSLDPDT